MMKNDAPQNDTLQGSESGKFVTVIAGTVILGVLGLGLSWLLKTEISSYLFWRWSDVLIGVAGTAPLALFLYWFVSTSNPTLAAFRESQIEFFANIGFEFTSLRIILMALAAGICEELLFRGFLQVLIERYSTPAIAILATSIIFGLMHWRTAIYAVIAGGISIYLGVMFWFTGNLLAPIITHAFYDWIAFVYTNRAITELRAKKAAS